MRRQRSYSLLRTTLRLRLAGCLETLIRKEQLNRAFKDCDRKG